MFKTLRLKAKTVQNIESILIFTFSSSRLPDHLLQDSSEKVRDAGDDEESRKYIYK